MCVFVFEAYFWSRAKGQEVIILCFNYSQERKRERDTITHRTEKYPCSQRDEKKYKCFGSRDHVRWETDCQVYYIYIYIYRLGAIVEYASEERYKNGNIKQRRTIRQNCFLSYIIFFLNSEISERCEKPCWLRKCKINLSYTHFFLLASIFCFLFYI